MLNEWFRLARVMFKVGNGANDGHLPVYVSEFGWDGAGGGATCVGHGPECVSERAQAVYAVRGALLCARLGAYRASWFFFADLGSDKSGVFARSGLTTSVETGSVPKQSYRAMAGLVRVLGSSHFLGAVQEDDQLGWVHTYVGFGVALTLLAWVCSLSVHVEQVWQASRWFWIGRHH